jgi:signal peptidase I
MPQHAKTPPPIPHRLPYGLRKFRVAILAVSAALLVRAILLEPFGVPTGSMAPAILGVHRNAICPDCGNSVNVGSPREAVSPALFDIPCPNCGSRDLPLADTSPIPGDRLLVDKSVFDWRSPRRWEIVVFRSPVEPDQPYVKRIVGLPGESVRLIDGDVAIGDVLARKSLPECRSVAVPICRMSCRPTEGWDAWWPLDPLNPAAPAPLVEGSDLVFPHAPDGAWRGMAFRPHGGQPITDQIAYNGRRPDLAVDWVHDFLVSCEVRFEEGSGELAISLFDGADVAQLLLSPRGPATLTVGRVSRAIRLPLSAAHQTLELVFFDRRASASLGGVELCEPIDLPLTQIRSAVDSPLRIRTRNLGVRLRNLRLSRDLHYSAAGRLGGGECRLGPNEYFVLGDNSANSEDSRFWPTPGVTKSALLGKPILIYEPTRWRTWTALGRTRDAQALDEKRFGWIR